MDDVMTLDPPPRTAPARAIHGVVVGTVASCGGDSGVRVDYPGSPSRAPLAARCTVALTAADVGRPVALLFEGGDAERPIVIGRMEPPAAGVEADGERLVLRADREIVLRCGDASITLTRAGKILIRGAYVLSRSSGVNRIRGGSVQIN